MSKRGPAGQKGHEVPISRTRLEFSILWPPSGRPSETEAADILLKVATALDYYSKGNASLIMPPLDFLVDIVGLTQERAQEILDSLADQTAKDSENSNALLAGQLKALEVAGTLPPAPIPAETKSPAAAKKPAKPATKP